MCGRSLLGNREISGLAIRAVMTGWSVAGKRGAVATDAQSRESELRHSSDEADEQSRATGGGVGGAKPGTKGNADQLTSDLGPLARIN